MYPRRYLNLNSIDFFSLYENYHDNILSILPMLNQAIYLVIGAMSAKKNSGSKALTRLGEKRIIENFLWNNLKADFVSARRLIPIADGYKNFPISESLTI